MPPSVDDTTFAAATVETGVLDQPALDRHARVRERLAAAGIRKSLPALLVELEAMNAAQAEALDRRASGRSEWLGPYETGGEIARTALGPILEAYSPRLDRNLEVLSFPSDRAPVGELAAGFARLDAAASGGAPGGRWARPVAVGEAVFTCYFAWEKAEGRTLARVMAKEKRFPCVRAMAIAGGLLAALERVHAAGLVHASLRPETILLAEGDDLTIRELGVGLHTAVETAYRAESGNRMMDASYVAPEVSPRMPPPDCRADLYSVGTILYEMVAGEAPGESDGAVVPIGEKVPGIPPELRDFVSRLLSRDPRDRPASAAEALVEIARLGGRTPALEPAERGQEKVFSASRGPTIRRAAAWSRRVGWAYAVVVAGAWLVVALAAVAFAPAPGEQPLTEGLRSARLDERRRAVEEKEAAVRAAILASREDIADARRGVSARDLAEEAAGRAAARLEEAADLLVEMQRAEQGERLAAAVDLARTGAREFPETGLAGVFAEAVERLDARIAEDAARMQASERLARARALAVEGGNALEAGRYADAAGIFEESLSFARTPEAEEGLAEAQVRLLKSEAEAHAVAGRFSEAIEACDRALSVRNDASVRVLRAAIDKRLRCRELAAEGARLAEEGDYEAALGAYRRALRLAGGDEAREIDRAVRSVEQTLAKARAIDKAKEDLAVGHPAAVFDGLADLAASFPDDEEIEALRARAREELVSRPAVTLAVPVAAMPDGTQADGGKTVGMEFVLVLGGAFPMGSDSGEDDERPARSVYVSTFYMARHELDNARFELFDPDHASRRSRHSPGDAFPAVNVRWTEAAAYCRWLSVRTGRAVRLPTEAEWEKAARGDDGRVFPWGDEPPAEGGIFRANLGQGEDRSAWGSDGYRGCSPVTAFGEFASPSGCLNMAGNVWEWCADRYSATSYMRAERRNPVGPSAGDERVLRGGSWSSDADVLRAANRSRGSELLRDVNIGFRCVLETP